MLQYSLLHLFGYKLSMDDLKAFRVSEVPLQPNSHNIANLADRPLTASPLVIPKPMTPPASRSPPAP